LAQTSTKICPPPINKNPGYVPEARVDPQCRIKIILAILTSNMGEKLDFISKVWCTILEVIVIGLECPPTLKLGGSLWTHVIIFVGSLL